MGVLCRFIFTVSLAVLGDRYYSNGASLDPFPLGTIGCLVSDVCDSGEICTNDLLFGSCTRVFSRALRGEAPKFSLTSRQILHLERQITALIQAGFTWKDAYTQCTLQNTLIGFRRMRVDDVIPAVERELCESALGVVDKLESEGGSLTRSRAMDLQDAAVATEEAINSEIASVLLRLLASADGLSKDQSSDSEKDVLPGSMVDEMDVPDERETAPSSRMMNQLLRGSQKRDEIVQIHKYFDKSKGTWKRDPFFSRYPEPSRESRSEYLDETPLKKRFDLSSILTSPSSYRNGQQGGDEAYRYFQPAFGNGQDGVYEITRDDGLGKGNLWESERGYESERDSLLNDENVGERGDSLLDDPDTEEVISETVADNSQLNPMDLQSLGDQDLAQVIASLALSPEDEVTLQALLDGTLSPSDLDHSQHRRLKVFIEALIAVLENDSETLDDTEASEPLLIEDPLDESINLPLTEAETAMAVGGDRDMPLEEELADAIEAEMGQPISEEVHPKDALTEPISNEVAAEDGDNEAGNDPLLISKPELAIDKKLTPGSEEDMGASSRRMVDPHVMYLQLSEPVDLPTALVFVENLTKVLDIPNGIIDVVRVEPDGSINLELSPDPEGKWDAEKIASEARNADSRLSKMTGGITVERAGFIGEYGNRVELKQNNRYVVLTFILVGTIAGVVLAVVTIYLIKRHSRARHKLQQIATNPAGDEPSNDYQDLCRQRMQGKTSEKPEPLHAASRIGSVSEAQVRSPSSRSSTSSWSEEPAATNMDISTGHIVLSYMEDHLKNQDRLDREWEAVSGYQADPSSTRVASDQQNVRKNRFSDVLPYDHSRVILSSNANVSNSDYINASFITDHDPRNPAYICTQGPLPHTVADFWQMIWEQGSVVIVMLSKLTENGTSLCHRYWPEEGSDLYHIYEVHLVSEHIWCDDYLVRSFYLKNLQTNETRTVTQFHFLTWPDLAVPASIKATLDFRRKVNKSFRGRSCPIVVHCSDGCGRAGTYCLIDMVLNKMAKGAKEIDMAATLEHIRDQRMLMVKTKEQFQFSLAAVAEEVHAILKALPQ